MDTDQTGKNQPGAAPGGPGGSQGSAAGSSQGGMSVGSQAGSAGGSQGREAMGNLNRDAGGMGGEPRRTIDKAAEEAQPALERMAGSAHAAVDKVSGSLTGAQHKMDEKKRQLADSYQRFAETGRDYVRSSPATSVLVALAAGYTLSKLLGLRHKR